MMNPLREISLRLRAAFAGAAVMLLILAALPPAGAQDAKPADKPVSFHKDVMPIFRRSCTGCHRPDKKKGELDMSSFAALSKGGKKGITVKPGDMKSKLLEMVRGPEPDMPEDDDPLSEEEISILENWIRQGAKDDTPVKKLLPDKPPIYQTPPVVSAMAWSADGSKLAVSGFHEILIHEPESGKIAARLLGESPRIESIAFSHNGKFIGASGGAPSRFGQVQLWDAATYKPVRSFMVAGDSAYGLSFSPDDSKLAFGSADKKVRIIAAEDGKNLLLFENHSDWVLGTTFSADGKQLLSGGRDKAMKLIDISNARFIDDVNKLLESVLCFARHPKEDLIAYGGDLGSVRIYKMKDNQNRTAANNDTNLVKMFERLPGPILAIDYAPDGKSVAFGGDADEVRVHDVEGKRIATFKGHEGAIYQVRFHPSGATLATAGHDGIIRIYEIKSSKLLKSFPAVPLENKRG